jgi:hypothetical protein
MDHTGLPSVQLQNAAQAADSENDPDDVYLGSNSNDDEDAEDSDSIDPSDLVDAIAEGMRALPAPVVHVHVPEPAPRTRNIERDSDGNITKIVEN